MNVRVMLILTAIYMLIVTGIVWISMIQPASAVMVTLEVLPYEPPVLRGEVAPKTHNPQKTIRMEDL